MGVYFVTGATSKTPKLNGPFNVTSTGANAFLNRSIVKILVDPQNNNIVFCATSSGVGGWAPKPEPLCRPGVFIARRISPAPIPRLINWQWVLAQT
ncbi:MAG: hypothetical protein WAK31_01070 [Chthoniobacterales bacterium]